MNILTLVYSAVVGVTLVCCATSPYKQCKGSYFDDLKNRIKVEPCSATKCKLTKGTNTTVNFRFFSNETVKDLKNDVWARLSGFDLPFLGVTQTSACGNVKRVDTGEAAGCPLEPGVEYLYKNTFYIHPFYPTSNLIVHWSLNSGNRQVICFEVPAVILEANN